MGRALAGLLRLIRYRFLLVAGLLPYGLGAAIAVYVRGAFDPALFSVGLVGLLFALIGVEAFNEYFDWQLGSDRVFLLDPKPVTHRTFFIGLAAFAVALVVAVFLTLQLGVAIIVLAFMGFLAALCYLAPPVKLAYRGLGEITIALAYGPLMMLGSYYVQARRMDALPLFASVIPAIFLVAICILNEVPDYFQDRIVGKRNICVRIGQENVVRLYGGLLGLFYVILLAGLFAGVFPRPAWLALGCVPISVIGYKVAMRTHGNPRMFAAAIRYMIIQYVVIIGILTASYVSVPRI